MWICNSKHSCFISFSTKAHYWQLELFQCVLFKMRATCTNGLPKFSFLCVWHLCCRCIVFYALETLRKPTWNQWKTEFHGCWVGIFWTMQCNSKWNSSFTFYKYFIKFEFNGPSAEQRPSSAYFFGTKFLKKIRRLTKIGNFDIMMNRAKFATDIDLPESTFESFWIWL